MTDNPNVCAFTSICEEDACWIPQYLAEAERLELPFVVLLDRCSGIGKIYDSLVNHRLCVDWDERLPSDGEFTEQAKQTILDRVVKLKYDWAMAWDIDETYVFKDLSFLPSFESYHHVNIRWLNLWDDIRHIRVDAMFGCGHRDKFYNLRVGQWKYLSPVVNGPNLHQNGVAVGRRANELKRHDLVCLHHGMMTRELRQQHKDRWDRIYTKAVGKNPYGFWSYALDEETYPATVKSLDEYLKENSLGWVS